MSNYIPANFSIQEIAHMIDMDPNATSRERILVARLGELSAEVAEKEGELSSAESKNEELQVDINEMESKNQELKGKVQNLKDKIAAIAKACEA
jgi:chromosome segregation ATPase